MHVVIAFAVVALLVFLVLAWMEGFAQHMGNPEPINWLGIILVALGVGVVVALIVAGLWSLFGG